MKKISLWLMALFYVSAGVNHFWHVAFYKAIMPPYLPYHLPLIYLSGVCEIIFGVLLIPVRTRRVAVLLIIALLIAVFPSNIQMAINFRDDSNLYLWFAIARLPLQFVLISWAWIFFRVSPPSQSCNQKAGNR